MVLQKRLDYGFNGYQVPAMPRASRSARGRGAHRRKVADNQMCAFDLLATVAGKLLQESENSPGPSDSSDKKNKPSVVNDMIKQEQEDEQPPLKEEHYDEGSCDESVFGCHGKNQNCAWKELTHAQTEPILVSLKDQLTDVDLSDFIAGRPEEEALEVMNIFSLALEGCMLKSLNLSNNALGEKGVRAFSKLLKSQSNLEQLYLMNDGISEEAARAVCDLIPSTEKLRVLHFHNNMTGDEGAIAISEIVKHSPALEDFRCSSTRVGSEGGVVLAESLGSCTHLKKLNLQDNMFGVDAGVALSKSLSVHTGLTEICLTYLNLEDEGATALAKALKESAPSLEVLDMAGNDITAEAAPTLAACVAAMQFLTKLNLAENDLKDEGAVLIGKALEDGHGELKEVDMSANSLRRAGARVLAKAVVNKPGFKLLNIDGNFISDEGIDEVKDIFKKTPDALGPLDENDPEGEDDDDSKSKDENNDDELESKLKHLEVGEEE